MADITIRNPAVVVSAGRAEGRSALGLVVAAARVVLQVLRCVVAAVEPAQSGARFQNWGFDRETMRVPR